MSKITSKVKPLILILIAGLALLFVIEKAPYRPAPSKALLESWEGYKSYFIDENGRVMRPKENDTVSEGQAYAMMRAVWMNDKETFDLCYRWSEFNLSRVAKAQDNLLAWRWQDGQVADWMPASDADIDYALSLVLAESKWRDSAPADMEGYGAKANMVLSDILNKLTYSTDSGRLYLSPWILSDEPAEQFPVNPSYYSPAHFRVFYEFTKDKRWLDLVDTTYFLMGQLAREFNGQPGVGLIPDWASVDRQDNLSKLEGKSGDFGWEAVRVIFRVALDAIWFDAPQAHDFFKGGIANFIVKEWQINKAVYAEYGYQGKPVGQKYENPLFYAAYYTALAVEGSRLAPQLLEANRRYLKRTEQGSVYLGIEEYYVNSWAWFPEGLLENIITSK